MFIERVVDFMLAKKSPYYYRSKGRPDIGGAYTQANLNNTVIILIEMITHDELTKKFPFTST